MFVRTPTPADRPTVPARRTPVEDGFTLVELLVYCILLLVVLGLIGGGIMLAANGFGRSVSGDRSSRQFDGTLDRFERDVANAQSYHRARSLVRDSVDLRRALVDGAQIAAPNHFTAAAVLDVHDVKVASANELVVVSQVDGATTTPECVRWTIAGGAGNWRLDRAVAPSGEDGSCGGYGAAEQMANGNGDGAEEAAAMPSFAYRLVCNGCPGAGVAEAGGACGSWSASSVPANQLGWIVAAELDVAATAGANQRITRARGAGLVSIRSRETANYRAALGC
jgi:hypothetical protein